MKILAKQRLVAKNYEAEFDKLYDIYVTPFMGNKTNTKGGEIIRALNILFYNYENNGYYFWKGWGVSMGCGSCAIYLLKEAFNTPIAKWVLTYENKPYKEKDLYKLMQICVDTIYQKGFLKVPNKYNCKTSFTSEAIKRWEK